jgi:hypothetical protein
MTTQTEMFPKTELDEATAVLSHLMSERDKAVKACTAADDKLNDAIERVRKQQHVVNRLQAMMPAAEPVVDAEASEDEDEAEDAEVLQIEGDVLDPITGEVTRSVTCPDCDGDGRIPDATGGGHHGTCETCQGEGTIRSAITSEPGAQALAEGLEPVAEEMLADLENEGVIVGGQEPEDSGDALADDEVEDDAA